MNLYGRDDCERISFNSRKKLLFVLKERDFVVKNNFSTKQFMLRNKRMLQEGPGL